MEGLLKSKISLGRFLRVMVKRLLSINIKINVNIIFLMYFRFWFFLKFVFIVFVGLEFLEFCKVNLYNVEV